MDYGELERMIRSVEGDVYFAILYPKGGTIFISTDDFIDLLSGTSLNRIQQRVVERVEKKYGRA